MKKKHNIKIYGKTGKDLSKHSEMNHQITFFNRLRREYPDTYGRIATHIKNEGKRPTGAARDKAEGMVVGASDIMIPAKIPFLCEAKSEVVGAKARSEQIEYLEAAQKLGAFCCIAHGIDGIWEAFNDWRDLVER